MLSPPVHQDRGLPRLAWIRRQVWQLARTTRATVAIIESIPWGVEGSSYAQMAGLGYVLRLALYDMRIRIIDVNPSHLRIYATGHAHCKLPGGGKTSVMLEASRRLGYTGGDDNEADALWLLHMGQVKLLGRKHDLPMSHTRALNEVDWNPPLVI